MTSILTTWYMWHEFSKKAANYAFVRTSWHKPNNINFTNGRKNATSIPLKKSQSTRMWVGVFQLVGHTDISNGWRFVFNWLFWAFCEVYYWCLKESLYRDWIYMGVQWHQMTSKTDPLIISLTFISISCRTFFHFSNHVEICTSFHDWNFDDSSNTAVSMNCCPILHFVTMDVFGNAIYVPRQQQSVR